METKTAQSNQQERKLKLVIGEKKITMVPFVHNALRDMIIAFTKNLSGHEGGKITIEIE